MNQNLIGLVACLSLLACGDMTSDVGELGHVEYRLHTDYRAETESLTDARLVAGHPVRLSGSLTDSGERAVRGDLSEMVHGFSSDAVAVKTDPNFGDDVPDAILTASMGTEGKLKSRLDGELVDRIGLEFVEMDQIDAITWVHGPRTENAEQVDGRRNGAVEGGSVSFVPVPMADGDRLLGDFVPEVTFEPEGMVVPDYAPVKVYEQTEWGYIAPLSYVFIEPGEVTITLADPLTGVEVKRIFEVEAFSD